MHATPTLAARFGLPPAPITAEQLIEARRPEDRGRSLWTTFPAGPGERPARRPTWPPHSGRRIRTREVGSIDRGVSLNHALWVLAEEMRKVKS